MSTSRSQDLVRKMLDEKRSPQAQEAQRQNSISQGWTTALLGILPTLGGAIFGGSDGAAVGADVGVRAMGQYTDAQLAQQKMAQDQLNQDQALQAQAIREDVGNDQATALQNDRQKHDFSFEALRQKNDLEKLGGAAGGGKLTVDQRKAAGYAAQGAESLDRYDQFLADNPTYNPTTTNPTNVLNDFASLLPTRFENRLGSPEYVQEKSIKGSFLNTVLRPESGGAINKEEYARRDEQLFPVAHDSKDQIKYKARLRKTVEAATKMQGGGFTPAQFDAFVATHHQESQVERAKSLMNQLNKQ